MELIEIFETLPLSQKTLDKRIIKNKLPYILVPSIYHPAEYYFLNKRGESCGMVKYYKGRKLSCYHLKDTKFQPVSAKI